MLSSQFNFDIPASYAGKSCTLEFMFPTQDQLETSAYETSGGSKFEIGYLSGVADKQTTYATAPKMAHSFGEFDLKPGHSTIIAKRPDCPAGKAVSFWMSPVGDSCINYFQDYNPCPIGLYVKAS
ncbi:hypothetical protein LTR37_004412 [Vermiconidia calcicola]|uniref:Uncharacterized protein n=1 Tax=Vermiconidia calcicola TaxID=1690605 RepID=A0ACC3NNG5_9PEZI|nr:hypothetical protein LTR37_004412 [Vermiconidia calcicola]